MKYFIAVACWEHAQRGGAGGFMQVNHGKAAPLKRLNKGDGVLFYSPTIKLGVPDDFKSFTLIGRVADDAIEQHDMGNGFVPFRRAVTFFPSTPAPIRPLLEELEFTKGKKNWGYSFRFGLLEIKSGDFQTIGNAMNADLSQPSAAFSHRTALTPRKRN
jgi:hypothetical protein